MKKILFLLLGLLLAVRAMAIPACPTPASVTQPDGSTLTLVLQGDEYYSFNTTLDGYTIVKNGAGAYVYAQRSGSTLVASSVVAHDAQARTAAEAALLQGTEKFLVDEAAWTQGQRAKARSRNVRRKLLRDDLLDYSKFRGLVILVNYNDVTFSVDSTFYEATLNTRNFTGITVNGIRVSYTGSVRDYYYDNSNGVFDPHFDVYGPVTVNYASTTGRDSAPQIFLSVIDSLDATVDFSKYDTDGDGVVDMIYFIVAGYTSNYSGNNASYLWPHMSSLGYYTPQTYDGVRLGRYACSGEYYGWESQRRDIHDGIGTICHEFSHVLGLEDLYDTDYAESGGQSDHPGAWDVMAGGSYNNYGRNPVGYSLFERTVLGFAHPDTIKGGNSYSINALNTSNFGYVLPAEEETTFFFENRQRTRWDSYLPGHGMLVTRVDQSNMNVWANNQVNVNPSHNYLMILRAGNVKGGSGSDTYPGTAQVTSISNRTQPSLRTWSGAMSPVYIDSIAENDGVITFDVHNDGAMKTITEDFEYMPVTSSTSAAGVRGNFTSWNFTRASVASPADTAMRNGEHSVAMRRPSAVTMAEALKFAPFQIKVSLRNPTNSSATFKLYYYLPGDSVPAWTEYNNSAVTVPAHSELTATWNVNIADPVQYRVLQSAGSTNSNCYIDDIAFTYYPVDGDVNLDAITDVSDATTLTNMVLGLLPPYMPLGDINASGGLDVSDVTTLINMVLSH